MRRTRFLIALAGAALVACNSTDTGDQPIDANDTDTDVVLPEAPDTGFGPGDEGSVMLVRRHKPEGTYVFLYGLFVDEHPGFGNLARCAVAGTPCVDNFPADEDDWVDVDPTRIFDPLFSDYRYVGLDIGFGDWSAPYYNGEVSYYFQDLTRDLLQTEVRGEFGVRFGVQWGDYQGDRDIKVSTELDLVHPRSGAELRLHDGDQLEMEWIPNGEGDIYLTIEAEDVFVRMYLLEDDGYHSLAVDDLQLGTEDVELNFNLARWNHGTARHRGNTLDIVATSEHGWTAEYNFVGGRELLEDIANTCPLATTLDPVRSGRYWGELKDAGFGNLITNANTCLDIIYPSPGEEGFMKVVLGPKDALAATYRLLENNANFYLLSPDCSPLTVDNCIVGADSEDGTDPEFISFFNDTNETMTAYLVLDARESTEGRYELDLDITSLQDPGMFNTCPEAEGAPKPIGDGVYFVDTFANTNSLDPGPGGCTGTQLLGPDQMRRVELAAGQTFFVNVRPLDVGDDGLAGNDADIAVYLVFNCTNAFSCITGSDIAVEGGEETVTYTNNSGAAESFYLVIDSKSALGPYFMTIDIQ